MDVKFDRTEAINLLKNMDLFCGRIYRETKELINLTKYSDDWDDRQSESFDQEMQMISMGIRKSLGQQKEYMKVFYEKINELY